MRIVFFILANRSIGLHGGSVGLYVGYRVTWWGVRSYMVVVLGYMVECMIICWGVGLHDGECWVT